ncbi:hypothetical protein VZH09_05950 [Synechococcus elongatus IITB7]
MPGSALTTLAGFCDENGLGGRHRRDRTTGNLDFDGSAALFA